MKTSPMEIPRVRTMQASGTLGFVVRKFPGQIGAPERSVPSRQGYNDGCNVFYDIYFMRTAGTIDEACQAADQEFSRYEWADQLMLYLTGTLKVQSSGQQTEVIISPSPEFQGFQYWVAEGLVGCGYDRSNFPSITTARIASGLLYHIPHEMESPRCANRTLSEVVQANQSSLVQLASKYCGKAQAEYASRGKQRGMDAILSHDMAGLQSLVLFRDPDSELWFSMFAHGSVPESDRKLYEQMGFPYAEHWKIKPCFTASFLHRDKASHHYFFDGSMKDAFAQLREAGIAVPSDMI